MHGQHDLAGALIDVGGHLADHGSYDSLLEPGIGCWRDPDGFQILGQGGKGGGQRVGA